MGEFVTEIEVDEMVEMVSLGSTNTVAFYEFYQLIRAVDPSDMLWRPREEGRFKDRNWFAEGGVLGMQDREILGAEDEVLSADRLEAQRLAQARSAELYWRTKKKEACNMLVSTLGLRLAELQRAFRRFQRLPSFKTDGLATFEEICEILNRDPVKELRAPIMTFCVKRRDDSDTVNVRELLLALSGFSGCTRPQRINFCFYLFDVDGSGTISVAELLAVLKASNLASTTASMRTKAETILKTVDKNESGTIDLEEFVVAMHRFPNVIFPDFDPPGQGGSKAIQVHPDIKAVDEMKMEIEARRAKAAADKALAAAVAASQAAEELEALAKASSGRRRAALSASAGQQRLPSIAEAGETDDVETGAPSASRSAAETSFGASSSLPVGPSSSSAAAAAPAATATETADQDEGLTEAQVSAREASIARAASGEVGADRRRGMRRDIAIV